MLFLFCFSYFTCKQFLTSAKKIKKIKILLLFGLTKLIFFSLLFCQLRFFFQTITGYDLVVNVENQSHWMKCVLRVCGVMLWLYFEIIVFLICYINRNKRTYELVYWLRRTGLEHIAYIRFIYTRFSNSYSRDEWRWGEENTKSCHFFHIFLTGLTNVSICFYYLNIFFGHSFVWNVNNVWNGAFNLGNSI